MKGKTFLVLIALVLCLLAMLSVGMNVPPVGTPEPEPAGTNTAVLEETGTSTAKSETVTPEPTVSDSTGNGTEESKEPGPLEEVVSTRTPMPTATPGIIAKEISRIAREAGLAGETFLGLGIDDWVNLGFSLLIVFAGYLVGTWLIRRVLHRIVKRTQPELDDRLLEAAGPGVRCLVVLLALQFATVRLTFVNAWLKAALSSVYFVIGLTIVLRILWHLTSLAEQEAIRRSAEEGREDQLAPLITLLVRMGHVLLVVVGLSILLAHFGVDVTAFAAALGLGGLALSLAARDTIADAIAGFIVLIDQPYRIGDRIEIQSINTWGDVAEIGLRTTRIRTRDNRMVIVPNSSLGTSGIINYSFPDPQYRIQTHVGIAYGTDVEEARGVLVDTVRHVEGVMPDEPVDALLVEMGDSAMIFRVRWWIDSYADTRRMLDRVHTALIKALDAAGIESPFPTQSVNLNVPPETIGQLSLARLEQ